MTISIPKWMLVQNGKHLVQYIQKIITNGSASDRIELHSNKRNILDMIYNNKIIPKCMAEIFTALSKLQ